MQSGLPCWLAESIVWKPFYVPARIFQRTKLLVFWQVESAHFRPARVHESMRDALRSSIPMRQLEDGEIKHWRILLRQAH